MPLPYMDYLLEEPIRAAVVEGGGVLVNVPSPSRFALHELLVTGERSEVFAAKADSLDVHSLSENKIELFDADEAGKRGGRKSSSRG